MILHVGQLALGAAIPALAVQLADGIGHVVTEMDSVRGDAQALANDISSLTADLSSLLAEQLEVHATVTAAAAQVESLPGVALAGVEQAIAAIGSGDALSGLQAALGSLPGTVQAGLEAAAEGPKAKLAEIAGKVAGLQGRIAATQARADALGARLQALALVKAGLDAQQAALGIAGIDAYAYGGPASSLGAELDGALRSAYPADPQVAGALILVCELAASWAALGSVLKVTP
jgi:hypothetical protein